VVFGSPTNVPGLFGGAWNSSSVSTVKRMTGTCAGSDGCPTCILTAKHMYPHGFPGHLSCENHTTDVVEQGTASPIDGPFGV
jgi:hypothetical protein